MKENHARQLRVDFENLGDDCNKSIFNGLFGISVACLLAFHVAALQFCAAFRGTTVVTFIPVLSVFVLKGCG